MTGTKSWYESKTVWGALVAILAAVIGFWDIDVPQADQDRAVEMIVQAIGAFGGLIALIGRFAARRAIG